jgi:hypothetical protein
MSLSRVSGRCRNPDCIRIFTEFPDIAHKPLNPEKIQYFPHGTQVLFFARKVKKFTP